MQETGKGVNELATTCVPASCLVHSRASQPHVRMPAAPSKALGIGREHTVVAAASRSERAKPCVCSAPSLHVAVPTNLKRDKREQRANTS